MAEPEPPPDWMREAAAKYVSRRYSESHPYYANEVSQLTGIIAKHASKRETGAKP